MLGYRGHSPDTRRYTQSHSTYRASAVLTRGAREVATDLDVMPDCAPEITGRVKLGEAWPVESDRHWRAKRDYTPEQLQARRDEIRAKASGQNVETFIADEWTLEYDLARAGLPREVSQVPKGEGPGAAIFCD